MSTVTRRKLRIGRPLEDCHSPVAWRKYQAQYVSETPYLEEVMLNARFIFMRIRQAIFEGASLTSEQKLDLINRGEPWADLHFTDSPPVNKAKLRVHKYEIGYCSHRVLQEIMHFIAKGTCLKHKKHLTQDANLG